MREILKELTIWTLIALALTGLVVFIHLNSPEEKIVNEVEAQEQIVRGHPTDYPIEEEDSGLKEMVYAERPVEQLQFAWIESDTPELDEESDQFEELCQIVMDEGGNTEPDDGIRMICDGVLNRFDSPLFPDSIHDVIFQKGQFQPVGDGTFYKFVPTERVIRICAEEMQHRTNTQVLYWRTGHYHAGTTPIAHIGHHYYSGR